MPVPVNDKRQQWLRENAPRPESLKTVETGSKLRVTMDTANENFGRFYKIRAIDTPSGTRYWDQYYGAVLDQDKKAQLAEDFNTFLTAQRLAQGPMNNLTSETDNLKREAPKDTKRTDDHVDVPVVLYSKDNQQPSQFTAQATFVKGGFLFDWKEQLSPRVIKGQTATFERWMGDGTFASPREQLEWIPRGQVLVYKVTGVIHCPDIVQFASGRSRSPPAMILPSPPRSSPVRDSHAATSKAPGLAKSYSQNRHLVSEDRRPRKRARNSSPIEDVVSKEEEVIDLVSDVDEVPQVAATYDGKGKARTPNLGDIIELSD